MAQAQGRIRVGIGGWTFAPWRGSFFPADLPQKDELAYAATRLTTIEINGTYYRTQTPATFAKWNDAVPDDFVFSVKAPRYATNRKVLAQAGPSIQHFLSSGIARLKTKLGPINWQFMPSKAFDPADFAAFLDLLPMAVDRLPLRHAVEVRHASFRTPDFVALLVERGIAAVVAGDSHYPQIASLTAPFVYARIMGTAAEHPLGYPDAALDSWAGRARSWAAGKVPTGLNHLDKPEAGPPRDVFLYVISGHKTLNPQAAMALVGRVS